MASRFGIGWPIDPGECESLPLSRPTDIELSLVKNYPTDMHVDLEEFAATGVLGPFSSDSSRREIETLLGAADEGGYPEFASYGHLVFDLGGGIGPPCRIQIAFPHSAHMRPANPAWRDWKPPTCFMIWPDRRLKWTLGFFVPGRSIDEAIASLDEFYESETISASNGLRILHNPKSRVDLVFEHDSAANRVTLAFMVAHPKQKLE